MAATRTLDRLWSAVTGSRTRLDPHRLRTCALVHDAVFRPEARSRWHPVARLVEVVYEHEVLRCPPDAPFDLDAVDVLAALSARAFAADDPGWIQALVEVGGRWVPGMRVELDDGRPGLLLGGDATRPLVFDGASVVIGKGVPSFPGEAAP